MVKEEHREIFRNYWIADVGLQKEILKKRDTWIFL